MYGEMTKKANKRDRCIRRGGRMSARKGGEEVWQVWPGVAEGVEEDVHRN